MPDGGATHVFDPAITGVENTNNGNVKTVIKMKQCICLLLISSPPYQKSFITVMDKKMPY